MFKKGDNVICINQVGWFDENGMPCNGPKFNDELIIDSISTEGGLMFYDYGINDEDGYLSRCFRKAEPKKFTNAITKELAAEVLTEQKKPQIERIEIKEKELV